MPELPLDTGSSYDQVAAEYAARYLDELAHKPLDRALLDWLAEDVEGRGIVADVGCGPGQVARYLHDRGVPTVGIDLSPEMVATAQRLNPDVRIAQGSILALPAAESEWAGIAAFYSIIHIPPEDLTAAATEFARVLQPGGVVLLSFHMGNEVRHLDEFFGQEVALDFYFYEFADLVGPLEEAGIVVEARVERRPYVPIETPTRRGYLIGRKVA